MGLERDQFDDILENKKWIHCVFIKFIRFFLLPSILARSCVRVSGVDLLDISANNGG